MFTDELQVLVRKIVAQKPQFISEANQALKHQFAPKPKRPLLWSGGQGTMFVFP